MRTYVASAGQTVEVFQSAMLAEVFARATRPTLRNLPPEPLFGDEAAGTYIQIAERGSPTTARVVITLGNNP